MRILFFKNCSFQIKRLHWDTWVKSSAPVLTSPRSGGGGPSPAETRWLWAPIPGPLQLSRGQCTNIHPHRRDFTSATMWSTPQATSTTCPGTVTWWMKEKLLLDKNKWEYRFYCWQEACVAYLEQTASADWCSDVTNHCSHPPWEVLVISLPDAQTASDVLPPNEKLTTIWKVNRQNWAGSQTCRASNKSEAPGTEGENSQNWS